MTKSCKAGAFKECVLFQLQCSPKEFTENDERKVRQRDVCNCGRLCLVKKKNMGTYVFAVTRYRIRPTTVLLCDHDHGRISSSPCLLELWSALRTSPRKKSMTGGTKTCATRFATEEVPNNIE